MSLEHFCHFAPEIEPVFSLQVTSSKIDIGPYKIVVVALSEGGGGHLCLQSADFAHGGAPDLILTI